MLSEQKLLTLEAWWTTITLRMFVFVVSQADMLEASITIIVTVSMIIIIIIDYHDHVCMRYHTNYHGNLKQA